MNDETDTLHPLLTRKQAAEVLGISERTLFTLTLRGDIEHVRVLRRVLYDPRSLAHFVAQRKRKGTGS